MLGSVGSSLGLFTIVIGCLCLAASALVTDTLLRDSRRAERPSAER